jgi:DNA mismatch endonuclease (patch repair protein)
MVARHRANPAKIKGSNFRPPASSEAVRKQMQNTKTRDTGPELALRSELHRLGLRYRVDVPPIQGMRRRADLVFKASRVAVFVDGCFWHGCSVHGSLPKSNSEWWAEKLVKTEERDRDTDRTLRLAGWKAVRVWEHENPKVAAARVARTIQRRLTTQGL